MTDGITTHHDGSQCMWDGTTREHYRMHPLYPLKPCEQQHPRTDINALSTPPKGSTR